MCLYMKSYMNCVKGIQCFCNFQGNHLWTNSIHTHTSSVIELSLWKFFYKALTGFCGGSFPHWSFRQITPSKASSFLFYSWNNHFILYLLLKTSKRSAWDWCLEHDWLRGQAMFLSNFDLKKILFLYFYIDLICWD
jgi:hypothetical protein